MTAQTAGLLSSFMAPEQLVGADRYRCDACKALVDADRNLRVLSPPAHLILSLKGLILLRSSNPDSQQAVYCRARVAVCATSV